MENKNGRAVAIGALGMTGLVSLYLNAVEYPEAEQVRGPLVEAIEGTTQEIARDTSVIFIKAEATETALRAFAIVDGGISDSGKNDGDAEIAGDHPEGEDKTERETNESLVNLDQLDELVLSLASKTKVKLFTSEDIPDEYPADTVTFEVTPNGEIFVSNNIIYQIENTVFDDIRLELSNETFALRVGSNSDSIVVEITDSSQFLEYFTAIFQAIQHHSQILAQVKDVCSDYDDTATSFITSAVEAGYFTDIKFYSEVKS